MTPQEAIKIQQELRHKVVIQKFDREVTYIGGADVSLNMFSKTIYAGIIVLKFPELTPVTHAVVQSETTFPYIPGLLSFREAPALIECWNKLTIKPDVLMVDGQGIAHPRRIGIASHIGVLLDIPTIGCAKSPLYGDFEEVSKVVGSMSYIHDRYSKHEILGVAYRSKERSKPLIISPGHRMDVENVFSITKECVKKYRLPEPTRLAHDLVNKFRTGEITE
ncbi:MAG: deoxyribonuclease V [Patescibacteria group bacterium]